MTTNLTLGMSKQMVFRRHEDVDVFLAGLIE
jgi:hypothetical protein